jgi:glucose-6-phosphate isomerase
MFSKKINFTNFKKKNKFENLKKIYQKIDKTIIKKSDPLLNSLTHHYKNSFKVHQIKKIKKYNFYNVIGMGGSSLGAKGIYSFLIHKIKKKFNFIDNLEINKIDTPKKSLNIIISKSGNTLETVANFNSLSNKHDSIFLTENKKSYLTKIASKLKSEIIGHNDFIGGRYSVLSETGMLPSLLMGLNIQKFKQLNNLIKNKNFVNNLIQNVGNILSFYKDNKSNSIILNYDEKSNDLFLWYQQLVAESLGKKSEGILPIISSMPKDNHSLMQLYLDGKRNNYFTFFLVDENSSNRIENKYLFNDFSFLKKKKSFDILKAQFQATQNIFKKRNIPFRSFVIKKRDEAVLGQLFVFFILETIMLGRALKVNPFDQPHVELIKTETFKILRSS